MKIGIGDRDEELVGYDHAGVNYIYAHSDYDPGIVKNDIALIKLKTPISSQVATPVLPLPKWLAFKSSQLSINMATSGFGFDENGNTGTKNTITIPTTAYCSTFNPSDSPNGIAYLEIRTSYSTKFLWDSSAEILLFYIYIILLAT